MSIRRHSGSRVIGLRMPRMRSGRRLMRRTSAGGRTDSTAFHSPSMSSGARSRPGAISGARIVADAEIEAFDDAPAAAAAEHERQQHQRAPRTRVADLDEEGRGPAGEARCCAALRAQWAL